MWNNGSHSHTQYLSRWIVCFGVMTAAMLGCAGSSNESPAVVRRLSELRARAKSVGGRFTIISLQGTKLDDRDAKILSGLRQLEKLQLAETALSDRGLHELVDLPKLQVLGLARTAITDAGLARLERFPQLRVLLLNETDITDAGMADLARLTRLSKVDVSGTKVTATGVAQLQAARPTCAIIWTPRSTDTDIEPSPPPSEPSSTSFAPIAARSDEELNRRRQMLRESWNDSISPAIADDLDENVEMAWSDGELEGGAVLPRWRQHHGPAVATESRFQKVIGLTVGATSDELIFLGTDADGWPIVSAEDLLDACVVGWHSAQMGQPGGVTFEPTAETLARDPQDGDLLRIEYFGAATDTVVGQATYEADRLMKCLSAGRDNLSRQPVTLAIAGWKSELDRGLDKPTSDKSAWHRFWIEPRSGVVRALSDGPLRMVDLRLGIETRHQQIQRGELADSKHAADPSARAFAEDLTRYYEQIAREHPSFAAVYNFAAIASLVGSAAASERSTTSTSSRWLSLLSLAEPRFLSNPRTTPSMVVTAERQKGNVQHFAQIAGGVTLQPVALRTENTPDLATLRQETLATRPQGRDTWTVATSPRRIEAAALKLRRRREHWQTDLRSGRASLVRELVDQTKPGSMKSANWRIRVPQLERDSVMVKLAKGGTVERSLTIINPEDKKVRLSPGTVSLPTSPGETPAYTSIDGKHTLAQYKNVWIQIDEPVRFVSTNGGHPVPTPEGPGRWIEYSPTAPHHVRKMSTSAGRWDYEWNGSQLRRIRADDGEIQLNYDPQGRLADATTNRGGKLEYRYDPAGSLRTVLREGNVAHRYEYDHDGSLYRASLPPSTKLTGAGPKPPRPTIQPRSPEAMHDQLAQQIANAGANVLTLRPTATDSYQLRLNGHRVVREVSAAAMDELSDDVVAALATAIRESQADARYPVLVDGPADLRQRLAVALRPLLADYIVTDTDDLRQSFLRLIGPPASVAAVRHEVVENIDTEIVSALKQSSSANESAGIVTVSGHNDGVDRDYGRRMQALIDAGQISDRFLILISCYRTGLQSMVDASLSLGRAKGVIGFLQPIDARLLPYVQAAVNEEATGVTAPLDHAEMQKLFQRAVDKAKTRARQDNDDWEESELNLLDFWHQQTRREQRQGIRTLSV